MNLGLKGLKLYELLATLAPVRRTRAGAVEEVQVVVFLGKVVVRKDRKWERRGWRWLGGRWRRLWRPLET